MKKLLKLLVAIGLTLILTGAAFKHKEPEAVTLTAKMQDGVLLFRLEWKPPERDRWSTPIEGYQWQLFSSAIAGQPDSLLAGSATDAETLFAEASVIFDCLASPTYFLGRVRAVGQFSEPAPWGNSDPFTMACNESPPGPPTVDLDTIPADTLETEPDSLVLLPVALGRVAWNRETQRLAYDALQDTATLCAFAYRDNEGTLIPRGFRVATMDSTEVVVNTDVLAVSDAEPAESACWDLVSIGQGSAEVYLCTTDCPPTLAGVDVQFLPHWMKWPLVCAGLFFLIVWGHIWPRQKKRRH